jgi:peptidyl-prolyl cis-trans isomerase SurA
VIGGCTRAGNPGKRQVLMMKFSSRVVAAGVVALAIVTSWQAVSAEILERVLVKVNGDIITQTDLEAKWVAAIRSRTNSQVDAEALKNDQALARMVAEITPRILVDTIDEMLELQLGKEKGYRVTDQQFKDWVGEIRKNQNLEDEQKFKAALAQEGMSMDDLRRNFEKQVTIYRVQQDEVGQKLQITEEEARQYYLTHKGEFVEPATVTLREIFIEIPTSSQKGEAGVNVGHDDEASQKAAAVRARIQAGEDFAKLAAEVSTSGSKANGGLIGPIAAKELSPSLQELIAKMKPGEVTQPLRTAKGFQILKLEAMTPPVNQPFDSVRDLVADKVYSARQHAEVKKFLSRLRSQALIVWKSEELKKAYEQQLKVDGQ